MTDPRRQLFVTSNGVGMGHLTRCLGIARAGGPNSQSMFLSMSGAVGLVAREGFPYEYVGTHRALGAEGREWNHYLRDRILDVVDHHAIESVVFDGTWPYGGLIQALRARPVRSVWIRRGMWKAQVRAPRSEHVAQFSAIVEPGDFAREDDAGATKDLGDAELVAPVTMVREDELLGREEARQALGLAADRPLALISLGAGALNTIADAQAWSVAAVQSLGRDWCGVIATPSISDVVPPPGAVKVSAFPLARYLRAFDLAIAAGGYNSFHENIVAGLPTLWLPNANTQTDDQVTRCRFAQRTGIGVCLTDPDEISLMAALRTLADDDVRSEMSLRARALFVGNGAPRAAAIVAGKDDL